MLLWIDGFEGYKTTGALTTALMLRRYASTYAAGDIVAGRVSGYAIKWTGTSANVTTNKLTTNNTIIVGCAFKFTTMAANPIMQLYDGATLGMSIRTVVGGELDVYLGTTRLAGTSTLSLATGVWYYIEFKVKCANSGGTYEIKVDNVSVLSDGSTDTQAGANAYHDTVTIIAATTNQYADDFYVCDSTGSLNNDFLGPCRVIAISPDGDSAVNWSTVYPALSDHHADVDDGALCDDDTTYVEDNTTGHRDLFDYANATIVTSIYGLSIETTCKVTDVNAVTLKTVIVSGANESTVSEAISATDYLTVSKISETDPATLVAWDVADINTAQFGIEVG